MAVDSLARDGVRFTWKTFVVLPAAAIFIIIIGGFASRQEAVYGYLKFVDNASYSIGTGVFTLPSWVTGGLEAKKDIDASNGGQSRIPGTN